MQITAETKARETYKKMCEDALKVNYRYEVMIEYESKLPNLTPDMAFWWWDHMGPIERYRLWSPNHLAFEWEIDHRSTAGSEPSIRLQNMWEKSPSIFA